MKTVVGIDPGITTAIAVFTLNGDFLGVFSKKGMSKAEVVRKILEYGSPIAICTDKKNIPKLVEEIASTLGAFVYGPDEDLKVKEKKEFSAQFKPRNTHERDAIAACLHFFKKHSKKFARIDNILKNMKLEHHSEKVKELILKGESSNISEALEKILGKTMEIRLSVKPHKVESKHVRKRDALREEIEALQRKLEVAQEYIRKLETRVKELEEQKRILLRERLEESKEIRERVLRDKEIELRENIIRNLRKELENERKIRQQLEKKVKLLEEEKYIEAKGMIPVIKIETFSRECLENAKNSFRVFNKVLYFYAPCRGKTLAKYLAALKPRAVIGEFGEEEREILEENGVMVIPKDEIKDRLVEFSEFFAITTEDLEKIAKEEKKKSFLKWLEAYKRRFL